MQSACVAGALHYWVLEHILEHINSATILYVGITEFYRSLKAYVTKHLLPERIAQAKYTHPAND